MSDPIAFAASFELTGPTAPEWMHLLPFGTFFGRDGRGPYAVRNADHAKQIVAATQAYQRGADMPVDYEHQSMAAADNGKPAPAAGWIKDLAIRADGVWGRVDWTAAAEAAIGAKEYRYVSPVFICAKDGTVLRIINAALTNHPNLELTALASQTTKDFDVMPFARIAKALDLPETATEAEIAAAAQSRSDRLKELEAAQSQINPDPSKYAPLEVLTALQRQVAAMHQSIAADKAAQAIAKAKADGKLAPAMEAWATRFASQSLDEFVAWAAQAPAIVAPGSVAPQGAPAASASSVSPETLRVCSQLGLDPASLIAASKDQSKETAQ